MHIIVSIGLQSCFLDNIVGMTSRLTLLRIPTVLQILPDSMMEKSQKIGIRVHGVFEKEL